MNGLLELVNTESFPKLKKIISKEHFRIERKVKDGFKMTFVTDLSKRGTYINKKIIGFENSYPILHGEFIGITEPATEFSYKFELIKKNKDDTATTESRSDSESIFNFESAGNEDYESENNEVPLPSKDSSDAQNPSKAEESFDFSPTKQPESNKRTHPEISETLFSKKAKKN